MSKPDLRTGNCQDDRTVRRAAFAAEVEKRAGIGKAKIDVLVHRFYDRVHFDPLLGPPFEARIADWQSHLARMCAFWSSVMLMTGHYHGRPIQVHAGDDHVPAGLAELLRRMIGELEAHMKKEELILFPMMRQGGSSGTEHPIAAMRADHEGHDHDVAEIRRLTGGPTLPDGACRIWTALYMGLEEFIDDLAEHMRLENEVLFPMFEPGQCPNGRVAEGSATWL